MEYVTENNLTWQLVSVLSDNTCIKPRACIGYVFYLLSIVILHEAV